MLASVNEENSVNTTTLSRDDSCRSSRCSFAMGKDLKLIVTTVMSFVGSDTTTSDDGTVRTYLKYRCPKPGCPKICRFLEKSGYSNPYAHLLSCYARNKSKAEQEKKLDELFNKARNSAQKSNGDIRAHFNVSALSEYEKAIHAYLDLIVGKSLPLSLVESAQFRAVSRYEHNVGVPKMTEVIFKLVELVEKEVGAEMRKTKGAILYDGWSANSMHFTGVIASYCTDVDVREKNTPRTVSLPRLTLLAMSPMSQVSACNDLSQTNETTTFSAEAYVQFFRETFDMYELHFDEWCVALIGDNVSSNKRVASITEKPHVGCSSHKLHLEVKSMIESHLDLKNTISSVHETMKSIKLKPKSAAVLRNLCELRPVMDNETRWSSKVSLLGRFNEIRTEIIDASEHVDADFAVNASPAFAGKVRRYHRMLSEINVITKVLQGKGRTLAECRGDLDTLISAVSDECNNVTSPLFGCRLTTKYIAADSAIVHSMNFENGIVKLQSGLASHLTDGERCAIAQLKEESAPSSVGVGESASTTMAERLAKRRKIASEASGYMDSRFILGSAAEIERLFSSAKHILTVGRRAMTPQLFEALIYLKYNSRFWNAPLVSKAIYGTAGRRAAARLEAHVQHGE